MRCAATALGRQVVDATEGTIVQRHITESPWAGGSNFKAASETLDRRARERTTLCGLKIPAPEHVFSNHVQPDETSQVPPCPKCFADPEVARHSDRVCLP